MNKDNTIYMHNLTRGFQPFVITKLPKFLEDAPIGSKTYGIKKTLQEKLDEINEMIFNQTIGRINYDLLQIGRNGLNDYVEFDFIDFKEYMNERSELYETFKYWLEGIDIGTSCVKENNNFSLDSLINNMKMINENFVKDEITDIDFYSGAKIDICPVYISESCKNNLIEKEVELMEFDKENKNKRVYNVDNEVHLDKNNISSFTFDEYAEKVTDYLNNNYNYKVYSIEVVEKAILDYLEKNLTKEDFELINDCRKSGNKIPVIKFTFKDKEFLKDKLTTSFSLKPLEFEHDKFEVIEDFDTSSLYALCNPVLRKLIERDNSKTEEEWFERDNELRAMIPSIKFTERNIQYGKIKEVPEKINDTLSDKELIENIDKAVVILKESTETITNESVKRILKDDNTIPKEVIELLNLFLGDNNNTEVNEKKFIEYCMKIYEKIKDTDLSVEDCRKIVNKIDDKCEELELDINTIKNLIPEKLMEKINFSLNRFERLKNDIHNKLLIEISGDNNDEE